MIGNPADQSSSGARASCSGMVRVLREGNGLPVNSFTSRSLISLYDACGVSSLSACARRNRSDVLVSCWVMNSKSAVELSSGYSHTLHGQGPGLQPSGCATASGSERMQTFMLNPSEDPPFIVDRSIRSLPLA